MGVNRGDIVLARLVEGQGVTTAVQIMPQGLRNMAFLPVTPFVSSNNLFPEWAALAISGGCCEHTI